MNYSQRSYVPRDFARDVARKKISNVPIFFLVVIVKFVGILVTLFACVMVAMSILHTILLNLKNLLSLRLVRMRTRRFASGHVTTRKLITKLLLRDYAKGGVKYQKCHRRSKI